MTSPKLIFRYTTVDNTAAKIKVEINTTEHFHIRPLENFNYQIDSEWYQGSADIVSYHLDELMGTKLRALYQRRKGRDLFDLWLVLTRNIINPIKVIEIFNEYYNRYDTKITRAMFEKNLHEKRQHRDFSDEVNNLISSAIKWNFRDAYNLVQGSLIEKLPGNSWLIKK